MRRGSMVDTYDVLGRLGLPDWPDTVYVLRSLRPDGPYLKLPVSERGARGGTERRWQCLICAPTMQDAFQAAGLLKVEASCEVEPFDNARAIAKRIKATALVLISFSGGNVAHDLHRLT